VTRRDEWFWKGRGLGVGLIGRGRSGREVRMCNDPTIGSYNNYHLSPNGIPSGNQRWYGLVYVLYKWLVNLDQSLGNG